MAHQQNITATPMPFGGSPGFTIAPTASYSNGVQISASEWDFTLLFFHTVPVPPSSGQEDDEVSLDRRFVQGVVMSPQHAKALARLLWTNVKRWEGERGEIQLPPGDVGQGGESTERSEPAREPFEEGNV